jgi:hypothetical protein
MSKLATVARPGCLCLVDGFSVPDFGYPQRAIVDGDDGRSRRFVAEFVEPGAKLHGTVVQGVERGGSGRKYWLHVQ